MDHTSRRHCLLSVLDPHVGFSQWRANIDGNFLSSLVTSLTITHNTSSQLPSSIVSIERPGGLISASTWPTIFCS